MSALCVVAPVSTARCTQACLSGQLSPCARRVLLPAGLVKVLRRCVRDMAAKSSSVVEMCVKAEKEMNQEVRRDDSQVLGPADALLICSCCWCACFKAWCLHNLTDPGLD